MAWVSSIAPGMSNLSVMFALKVLPSGALSNDLVRKHFHKEALALAKLNHPNIETIYEFNTQDSVDFLVMEYVPGKTLAHRRAASD